MTIPADAQETIERCIMEDEGGWVYTDRADDAGGPTYGGMTWRTFNTWRDQGLGGYSRREFVEAAKRNDQDLQNCIRQCYHDLFWRDTHCSEVPEFAQKMFFSACVNMGGKEALKCLQMAANEIHRDWPFVTAAPIEVLVVDGHWGPKTQEAVNSGYISTSSNSFKIAFSDAAMERYIRIVQRNAREWRDYARRSIDTPPRVLQSENLMGWFNRARRYRSM